MMVRPGAAGKPGVAGTRRRAYTGIAGPLHTKTEHPMPKTLYLVRHAKSAWDDPSLDDRDRPLNKRGLRAAPDMGRRLQTQGHHVDHVISSPANRAHSTARAITMELGIEPGGIQIEDDLYFQGTHGMLRTIERVDDGVERLMMVGHNPTMTALLNQLAGVHLWNMPTAAIGIIEFDMESWGLVDSTPGKLVGYDKPKGNGQFTPVDLD